MLDTQHIHVYLFPAVLGFGRLSPAESFRRVKSEQVYFKVTVGIQFYGAKTEVHLCGFS